MPLSPHTYSDWVGDIVDAIGEESISSENVTEAILTHIQDDCQMFGGDMLEPLARKRVSRVSYIASICIPRSLRTQ